MNMYQGLRKKDNKKITGYFLKIKKKCFLIKPTEIAKVLNVNYIFLKGGVDNYEVVEDTINVLEGKNEMCEY